MSDSKLLPVFIVLSIVQTLSIFYLFYEMKEVNANVEYIKSATLDSEDDIIGVEISNSESNAKTISPDYTEIREIFRQELIQQLAQLKTQSQVPQKNITSNLKSDPTIVDETSDQLDMYISQGYLSHQDMTMFQMKVGKLAPDDQDKILRRLARAINSQQLDIKIQ